MNTGCGYSEINLLEYLLIYFLSHLFTAYGFPTEEDAMNDDPQTPPEILSKPEEVNLNEGDSYILPCKLKDPGKSSLVVVFEVARMPVNILQVLRDIFIKTHSS